MSHHHIHHAARGGCTYDKPHRHSSRFCGAVTCGGKAVNLVAHTRELTSCKRCLGILGGTRPVPGVLKKRAAVKTGVVVPLHPQTTLEFAPPKTTT